MNLRPPKPIGFLVWNPERSFPTHSHPTYVGALAEAEWLRNFHPDQRFYVMSPVVADGAKKKAEAYSDGLDEGLAQAHREIMHAEAHRDELGEKLHALDAQNAPLQSIRTKIVDFQSIAADCLCWFEGFVSAYAMKEAWERPWTPDLQKSRDLNGALQTVLRSALPTDLDDEIPFWP